MSFEKEIRVAAKAPDNRLMIMGLLKIHPEMAFRGGAGIAEMLYHGGMEMQSYKASDQVEIHSLRNAEWLAMNELGLSDGFAYVDVGADRLSIADLPLFRITELPKDIYISQSSVNECFDRILQLQHPKQVELKKTLRELEKPPVIQARIYSLAA